MSAINLSPAVLTYVTAFVARRRRLSFLKAAGIALALTLAWMLAACLIDRFAHLAGPVRLVLLLTNIAAVVVLLARPASQALRGKLDAIDATAQLETYDKRFAQKLQTVASQMAAPMHLRGSPEFLQQLGYEVDTLAIGQRADTLLPARLVNPPWFVALGIFVIIGVLLPFSYFGMPTLIARYFAPLADIMPVTTTRLTVAPGSIDLVQGEPLAVTVQAVRLGDALVTLHTAGVSKDSEDSSETWSTVAMNPNADQTHAFTIAAVDQDLRYYVSGGDATSRTFVVRVKRPPSVAEFKVRYVYPDYTGRQPLTVTNTDGLIEAPVGTEATIAIAATEPLTEASLTIAGKSILTQPTIEPSVRQAKITISKDAEYHVHLTSDRNVPGGGPGTMFIRAVPDRAPLVRMLQPADDMRLSPRDILPIQYQAMDDYGLEKVEVHVQVNSVAPRDVGIKLRGDSRRQEAIFNLDLAAFDVKVGDVVTIHLSAVDKIGQKATSESRQLLISPRSIDLNTHLRIAELRNAMQLSQSLVEELQKALAALDQARATGFQVERQYMTHFNALSQHLASTSDQATLMRLALGRAVMRSDTPALSTTLANFVDAAQIQVGIAEEVSSVVGQRTPQTDIPRNKLAAALQQAQQLQQQLKVIGEGEQAKALLADRQNVRDTEKTLETVTDQTAIDRVRQTLVRAKEDIAAGATLLGLNPADASLDAHLTNRAEQSKNFAKAQKPIDFAQASQPWMQELQSPAAETLSFDQRLAAAAQVEAIRPDPELRRAADLQLAARAAVRLQVTVSADEKATTQPVITEPAQQFAPAIAALQVEHDIARHPENVIPPDQLKAIRVAAGEARVKLARWAGDKPAEAVAGTQGESGSSEKTPEELAIEAGAAAEEKNYEKARELDAEARKKLEEKEKQLTGPEQMNAEGKPAQANDATATKPEPSQKEEAADATKIDDIKKIEVAKGEEQKPDGSSPEAEKSQASSDLAKVRAQEAKQRAEERERQQAKTDKATERAKELDRIQGEQEKLTEETAKIKEQKLPPEGAMVDKQSEIAKAIAEVEKSDDQGLWDELFDDEEEEDTRELAAEAIMAAQEQLAGMPEQMARASEAAKAEREAEQRQKQAENAAKQAENVIKERKAPADAQAAQEKAMKEQATKAREVAEQATAKQTTAQEAAAQAAAKAQAAQEAAVKAEAARVEAAQRAAAAQAEQKPAADQASVAANQTKVAADQANQQAAQAKAQADQQAAQAKQQADAAQQQSTAQQNQAKAATDQAALSKAALDQAQASADAAQRTDEEAKKQLDDAQKRLDEARKPILPAVAELLAGALSKFSPETTTATIAINQQLLPVLKQLDQAMTENTNPGAIDQFANQARQAIDVVQAELRKGQDELVERDPLVAAKAFAEAAAEAMRKEPPDMDAVARYQQSTSNALERAWEGQLKQASQARLAQLPSFGVLFSIPITVEGTGKGPGSGSAAPNLTEAPALREWGRLRTRETEDLNASLHESDAPEYQDALKAYFEALGKANVNGPK